MMEKCHWASFCSVSNLFLVGKFPVLHGNAIHLGFCRDMAMQADTDIHQQKGLIIFCLCSENVLLLLSFCSQQTGEEHEEAGK